MSTPSDGETIYNQPSPTARFSVTGNPTSVRCRMYLTSSPAPSYVSCSNSFSRSVGYGSVRFQLEVRDAFGNVWTITRNFSTVYFG